jgi:type VI secretion system protein ImpC
LEETMAERSRVGIEAEFTIGKRKRPAATSDTPFRMLVIADFGGHQTRGEVRTSSELRVQRVDLDSLPLVLRKIAPRVPIAIGGEPPFTVAIGDMDGFHPDQLFAELQFFAPLRELRRQLSDGKAFARAAAMLGKVAEPAPASAPVASAGDDLLRLLGRPASPEVVTPASTVAELVRQAVAPHIVGKPDPRQAELIVAVDGMTGELMRAVLHDAGFQRLEAAWRSLDRLVHVLELDENLQIFVLDASREELAADFAAKPNLADSALYRIVVDRPGEAPQWSLLVNGNPCGRRQEDAALLGRLGSLAQEIEATVVTGQNWAAWTSGFASLEDQRACGALRSSPAAHSIGAATPGFLLRQPYGKGTDAIESFAFSEQSTPPVPERFLWGSAAFLVAELLARSYTAAGGWDFSPGDECVISDLPIHVFTQDGESVETSGAQVWLGEAKVDELIKEGLMPLVAVKGRGEVRIPRFQSIASPPAALAGPWR